jgi:predicted RNase H-like HicB family nuclease
MKREFDVVIERDTDGYFVASVPSLPGCHTQAKSMDKLSERISEAISLCLEEYGMEEEPIEFVGIQRVAVEA